MKWGPRVNKYIKRWGTQRVTAMALKMLRPRFQYANILQYPHTVSEHEHPAANNGSYRLLHPDSRAVAHVLLPVVYSSQVQHTDKHGQPQVLIAEGSHGITRLSSTIPGPHWSAAHRRAHMQPTAPQHTYKRLLDVQVEG